MPTFSANLAFLYPGLSVLDAIAAAARDGFAAVEIANPYTEKAEDVAAALRRHGVTADLINSPAGDAAAGEKGLLALPGRENDFARSIETIKVYAAATGAKKVNLLAGIPPAGSSEFRLWAQVNLRARIAAHELSPLGVTVLLEHMNPSDMPGYFLDTPAKALWLVEIVSMQNCKVQYDVYHAARSAGNLTQFLRENMPSIGHIQIADTPGRHQPGTGELNYRFILREIDRLGYAGCVGLEYSPSPDAGGVVDWLGGMGYAL